MEPPISSAATNPNDHGGAPPIKWHFAMESIKLSKSWLNLSNTKGIDL